MSHHADYPLDPRLDITDVYCFTGTLGTVIHPSTVFVMNVAPLQSRGWNPDGYYEFRVDTTSPLDYIEDITWRVTFAADAAGVQHVRIEQLVGQAARDRNATGEVITPDGASLEQVITCSNGITFFAGERGDPFFNDARFTAATRTALSMHTNPNYAAFYPAHNDFGRANVSGMVFEVPGDIIGKGTIGFWGNTAVKENGVWHQIQHAAGPLVGFINDFSDDSAHIDYNASIPSEQLTGRPANPSTGSASGFWGQMRDNTAAVVAARGTYANGPRGQASPLAYGAYVADTIFPDVLTFKVGSKAMWDPWNMDIQNGKGLTACAPDSIYDLVLNEALTMGLTYKDATGTLLPYFPYLAAPVLEG